MYVNLFRQRETIRNSRIKYAYLIDHCVQPLQNNNKQKYGTTKQINARNVFGRFKCSTSTLLANILAAIKDLNNMKGADNYNPDETFKLALETRVAMYIIPQSITREMWNRVLTKT